MTRRAHSTPLAAGRRRIFFRSPSRRTQARSTAFGSTRRKHFIPIRRRVFNRRDRTDRRAWSIPRSSAGRTRTGRASKCRARSSTKCTSAPSRREGTWRAAAKELAELARIGITVIEMMPIADFPGEFGWGYDGVDLFAPCRLYGTPDDLRAFVERRALVRPGRNSRRRLQPPRPGRKLPARFFRRLFYRSARERLGRFAQFRRTELRTGARIFHHERPLLDRRISFRRLSLRRHAKHSSTTRRNTSSARSAARRAPAAGERSIILIAENEPQETKLVRPRSEGGDDLDGLWNDDLHHSAMVALDRATRSLLHRLPRHARRNSFPRRSTVIFFRDSRISGRKRRAASRPSASPPEAFVAFIENHDQVSNSAFGERVRLQTSPGRYRAMTALLLLGPWTPLLFQGQEFGASSPFLYFSDVSGDLREAIRKGRFKFLAQFPSLASEEVQAATARSRPIRKPSRAANSIFRSARTIDNSTICIATCFGCAAKMRAFGTEAARRGWRCPRRATVSCFDYFGADHDDRLLLVNLGPRVRARARCRNRCSLRRSGFEWETLWTSESPRYGGPGRSRSRPTSVGSCPPKRPSRCARFRETAPRVKRPKAKHGMIVDELDPKPQIASSQPSFAGCRGMREDVARDPAQPRMARDQRSRRLRFRHCFRRDHAPISRHSHCRACPRRSVAW